MQARVAQRPQSSSQSRPIMRPMRAVSVEEDMDTKATSRQDQVQVGSMSQLDKDSLDARIAAGEFGDVEGGSTKEKLTRPIRKLLAVSDPLGLGELFSPLARHPATGSQRLSAHPGWPEP